MALECVCVRARVCMCVCVRPVLRMLFQWRTNQVASHITGGAVRGADERDSALVLTVLHRHKHTESDAQRTHDSPLKQTESKGKTFFFILYTLICVFFTTKCITYFWVISLETRMEWFLYQQPAALTRLVHKQDEKKHTF